MYILIHINILYIFAIYDNKLCSCLEFTVAGLGCHQVCIIVYSFYRDNIVPAQVDKNARLIS